MSRIYDTKFKTLLESGAIAAVSEQIAMTIPYGKPFSGKRFPGERNGAQDNHSGNVFSARFSSDVAAQLDPKYDVTDPEALLVKADSIIAMQYYHSGSRLQDIEWTRSQKDAKYANLGLGRYIKTTGTLDTTNADTKAMLDDGTSIYTYGETAEYPEFDLFIVDMDYAKYDAAVANTIYAADPVRKIFPHAVKLDDAANTGSGPTGKCGPVAQCFRGINDGGDKLLIAVPKKDVPAKSFLMLQGIVARIGGGN